MKRDFRPRRRRGVALALALLLIAVVVMASVTLVSVRRRTRDEIDRRHDRLQTDLFVEAGFERAMVRLRTDPAWSGEVWLAAPEGSPRVGQTTAEPLARVEIKVGPAEAGSREADRRRTVTVSATWPVGAIQAVTETRVRPLRLADAERSDGSAGPNATKRGSP